jgi:hypothetical protein
MESKFSPHFQSLVWCVCVKWVKECIFYFKSSFIEQQSERGVSENCDAVVVVQGGLFFVCRKRMSERICRNPLLLSFFEKKTFSLHPEFAEYGEKFFCYR